MECNWPNCVAECYGRCVVVARKNSRDRTNCQLPNCDCRERCKMAGVGGPPSFYNPENWLPWHGMPCPYCDQPMDVNDSALRPSVDHVWPRSKGGNNMMGNLVRACWSCNQHKHYETLNQWLLRLRRQNDPRVPFVEAFMRSRELIHRLDSEAGTPQAQAGSIAGP